MGISANPIAIWLAALVGSVATAAFGQSTPVLMGAAAYGDWRGDAPGVRRKITPADMPPPYATASANNGPTVAQRPPNAWPKAPPRFVVQLLATGLDNPRLIRVSPSGDVFIAESRPGRIRVFRAAQGGGKPEIRIFAEDLYQPFGIAFWPPGPNPRYVYIANTDSVVRFPYRSGDLQPAGPAETIVTGLPQGGHSTRDVVFSADGTRMFVSVGSRSNVGERPIYAPWQSDADRALVLAFTPEGRDQRFYATGLRNCVGMAVQPGTGELWCSVNERDGFGDANTSPPSPRARARARDGSGNQRPCRPTRSYKAPTVSLIFRSRITRNRQRCMLPPLGAQTLASRILRISSFGTGSGFSRRIDRVVRMISNKSAAFANSSDMTSPPACWYRPILASRLNSDGAAQRLRPID